ncbi:MAG TPA: cobalamin-binding protein [Alphaproteobacteria bacterium]
MPRPRVISLLASATEIVVALGARDLLVARSHECDFPPDVRDLPAVSAPKLDPRRPSGDIDRQVRTLLEQALSIYQVDADALRELAPDVIVTQTQCEVCAVSMADVEAALADWIGSRPQIVAVSPFGLEDVFADIVRIAAALGRDAAGRSLVRDMRRRMDAIAARAKSVPRRPRVATIEWIEPLMAGGNWMPDLIAMAGGRNLLGESGRHSPSLAWDDLVRAEPEVILVLPCGFDIARTRAEMPALTGRAEWRELPAVRSGAVYLLDGNQYFNRPGPRLVESLEIVAEILHPETFRFGHEGAGWIRFGEPGS